MNIELETSATDRIKVPKLWGFEDIIHNSDGYCCKRLVLNRANVQCSLHYHYKKNETFTCTNGLVWIEYYPEAFLVQSLWYEDTPFDVESIGDPVVSVLRGWAKDALTVPAGMPHRFWTEDGYAELFEASTTHSDDDVVRLEDARELPHQL